MAHALECVEICRPNAGVVANVTARPVIDSSDIVKLLVEQVTGTVRWRETVLWLQGEGVSQICEIGVGNSLSGMIRRIDRSINCLAVNDSNNIKTAVAELEKRSGDV